MIEPPRREARKKLINEAAADIEIESYEIHEYERADKVAQLVDSLWGDDDFTKAVLRSYLDPSGELPQKLLRNINDIISDSFRSYFDELAQLINSYQANAYTVEYSTAALKQALEAEFERTDMGLGVLLYTTDYHADVHTKFEELTSSNISIGDLGRLKIFDALQVLIKEKFTEPLFIELTKVDEKTINLKLTMINSNSHTTKEYSRTMTYTVHGGEGVLAYANKKLIVPITTIEHYILKGLINNDKHEVEEDDIFVDWGGPENLNTMKDAVRRVRNKFVKEFEFSRTAVVRRSGVISLGDEVVVRLKGD